MNMDDAEGPERLVHLDFKGAPPKLEYLETITPLLKKWGATGFLVEYEDMFPYSEELSCLASPQAYTTDEILKLNSLAEAHEMKVIPLIQTFGHFEFVLKHPKFIHLREIPSFSMVLCPVKTGSLPLIGQMIDQVLNLHPLATHIHIGADEVYHIGLCPDCQRQMLEQNIGAMELFFNHVKNVLLYIKNEYPDLQAIMWDDMFRETDLRMLRESGLPKLVEPMVWFYERVVRLPDGMWERYAKAFPNVWVASAFKGATGPCMFATDIGYHIENHKSWLLAAQEEIIPKFSSFKGFCLTGWQRYDHYAVLCELLPVALPSLAVCLLTFSTGAFTAQVHKQASEDLQFKALIPFSPHIPTAEIPYCDFPGSQIYTGVQKLIYLKHEYRLFKANERMNGWMSHHHVKNNFTNPAHISHFLPEAQRLLAALQSLLTELDLALSVVFHKETVTEFLEVNLVPKVEKVKSIVDAAERQLQVGTQPYRYYSIMQTPH